MSNNAETSSATYSQPEPIRCCPISGNPPNYCRGEQCEWNTVTPTGPTCVVWLLTTAIQNIKDEISRMTYS